MYDRAPTFARTSIIRSVPVRSPSSPTGAFLAAEIAVAVVTQFRVRPAPVLGWTAYVPAQGRSVLLDRIAAPNSWAL
jgi:hypothetical protein